MANYRHLGARACGTINRDSAAGPENSKYLSGSELFLCFGARSYMDTTPAPEKGSLTDVQHMAYVTKVEFVAAMSDLYQRWLSPLLRF